MSATRARTPRTALPDSVSASDARPGVQVRYDGALWTIWSSGPDASTRWLVNEQQQYVCAKVADLTTARRHP